jgi:flagellar basal body rod protein FlgC
MPITQLGLHGPQMAYAGFEPKSETVVTTSALDIVGEYVDAISAVGEYQTAIDVVGEFE